MAAATLDVDMMIEKLLSVGRKGAPGMRATISENDMVLLINAARLALLAQPSFLEIEPPIKVCGDLHGQYADLLRIINHGGLPPTTAYLFLGDYVDRGKNNLETISLLLAFKVKWPTHWLLLRGNHECMNINRVYGFYDECQRRYQSTRLWTAFHDAFNCLPLAALIGGRILCMHGGLSPHLQSLQQLRDLPRPMPDPPNPSMALDLLWADPDPSVKGWQANMRGVAFVFGADIVASTCQKLNLDLICRAHQVVQDGYEFFAQRRLVTLFSAPHYCGEFDNAAAIMNVSGQLQCSFDVLKPKMKQVAKALSPRTLTCYGVIPK